MTSEIVAQTGIEIANPTPNEAEWQPVNERGWRKGFKNLLRLELGRWWGTSKWWTQSLIWLVAVNGFNVMALAAAKAGMEGADTFLSDVSKGLELYIKSSGFMVALGVIILMQSAIVGDKETGLAAWILSKPVSRTAYILSKLVSQAVGILITAVLIPGLGAYGLLSLFVTGHDLALLPFLATMGVIGLEMLFYLTLTLMTGTFFEGRGGVIGAALAFFFGQQFLLGPISVLPAFLPFMLSNGLALPFALGEGNVMSSLGAMVELAPLASFPALTPILATAVLILLCVGVAVWRFNRHEF